MLDKWTSKLIWLSGGGVGEEPGQSVGRCPAEAAADGLPQPGAGEAQAEGKPDSIFRSRCRVFVAPHRGRRESTEKLGRFWTHRLNIAIALDMSDSWIYDSLNQGIAEVKNHLKK